MTAYVRTSLLPLLAPEGGQVELAMDGLLVGGESGVLCVGLSDVSAFFSLPASFEFSALLAEILRADPSSLLRVQGVRGPGSGEFTLLFFFAPADRHSHGLLCFRGKCRRL